MSEGSDKGYLRRRFAAWRKAHPEAGFGDALPSKKDLGDMLRAGTMDRLENLDRIASDPRHPKQFEAIKTWVEYDIGKPRQAVELTGADGAPVQVSMTTEEFKAAAREVAGKV